MAIIDSNCDPDKIDYPIPGNDDAQRAISLYCELIAKAAVDGIARQHGAMGVDVGAMAEAVDRAIEGDGGMPARAQMQQAKRPDQLNATNDG